MAKELYLDRMEREKEEKMEMYEAEREIEESLDYELYIKRMEAEQEPSYWIDMADQNIEIAKVEAWNRGFKHIEQRLEEAQGMLAEAQKLIAKDK
jgi:hypothetical protein